MKSDGTTWTGAAADKEEGVHVATVAGDKAIHQWMTVNPRMLPSQQETWQHPLNEVAAVERGHYCHNGRISKEGNLSNVVLL